MKEKIFINARIIDPSQSMDEEGSLILFPSAMEHCTASHSNDFKGERLAIVGDITLVYKEDGDNDYSMGFVNPKFWRTYK